LLDSFFVVLSASESPKLAKLLLKFLIKILVKQVWQAEKKGPKAIGLNDPLHLVVRTHL
jgi:hypothetical protein